jgi:hypothetical protein
LDPRDPGPDLDLLNSVLLTVSEGREGGLIVAEVDSVFLYVISCLDFGRDAKCSFAMKVSGNELHLG